MTPELEIATLNENYLALAKRVRTIEKMLDTKDSPWWKRLWFRVDGWPAWYRVADRRSWRPWHRDH